MGYHRYKPELLWEAIPTFALQLLLTTRPGTTLIAGGNEAHAGPRASKGRMFAFAIGVLESDASIEDENEDNNGEYRIVLSYYTLTSAAFYLA